MIIETYGCVTIVQTASDNRAVLLTYIVMQVQETSLIFVDPYLQTIYWRLQKAIM